MPLNPSRTHASRCFSPSLDSAGHVPERPDALSLAHRCLCQCSSLRAADRAGMDLEVDLEHWSSSVVTTPRCLAECGWEQKNLF